MGTASIHKHSHKPPVYIDCTGLVFEGVGTSCKHSYMYMCLIIMCVDFL